MVDCSIVCIFNNKKSLNKYLINSLDIQDGITIEKKFVDNTDNKFNNAKDAIKSVINELKGKYIIICHQDIKFTKKNSLKEILKHLNDIKKFGIVGVAGVIDKEIISNIKHGTEKKLVSTNKLEKEKLCETLDECLFIIKNEKKYIKEFNDLKCFTWHLYAVEYSLKMRINKENVYVIPANIYHASSGYSFDNTYFKQLKVLSKEYGNRIKKINTTMGFWHTNIIILNFEIFITKLRRLKKKVVKLWKK